MNINNLWLPKNYLSSFQSDYRESGILEAHRYLYLFFDPNDLDKDRTRTNLPGDIIIGKAIQINLSVSEGGKKNIEVMPFFRGSDNSDYITMNMYTYDTRFISNIRNFNDAEFILSNGIAGSVTNDWDMKRQMDNGARIYSKDIRDDIDKKSDLSFSSNAAAPSIPDPVYYTMRQQENELDENYCITSLNTVISHIGFELINDETNISIMNTRYMDTFDMQMRDKIREIHSMNNFPGVKMFDNQEISNWMMIQSFMTMQHGYTYIYDTNNGRNIMETSKSYKAFNKSKYQFKEKMIEDLDNTISMLEHYANKTEKEFGSVNILYTPSFFGDKISVKFKDYRSDNQPNLQNNSNSGIGMDSGTKIQDVISETIDILEE